MSKFLDELKKAADTGEFNSEAAKKINEVTELADDKAKMLNTNELKELVEERMKESPIKAVTEQEALELNSAYEIEMAKIKKQDAVNAQLATLIEIEDMVKASVIDMMSFVEELDTKFEKEFEAENPMFGDLALKIEELKNVFEPTLMEYKHKQ